MPKCRYSWHTTSIGGFAQCEDCNVVNVGITEDQCMNWINPKEGKAKKLAEREKIRQATIEWLKKKESQV